MIRKEKLEELKTIIETLRTVEIVPRKVEQEKKFLQSEVYSFKLNNRMIISREKLVKGKKDGSACIIVPILENGDVMIVIEPRVFTDLTVGIGFPAGYVEADEPVEVAALRELREETGLVPEKLIELDSYYQDEGCSSALNHIFLALDCKCQYDQELDPDEVVQYMTLRYDELFDLEKMGYMKGCNAKLALSKSKPYMKGR